MSVWRVLKRWHMLRHSFIPALASKGVGQRVIDEFAGHSTDEHRGRCRHIFPDVKARVIADVFG